MIRRFFLTLALIFPAAVPVRAQEPGAHALPDKAFLQKLESKGLWTNPAEGALPRDLWQGTKRSVLLKLIPALPDAPASRTVQRLTYGLLLSAADSGRIENDIPVEPGRDLLTLRLNRLLAMGAYPQALKLYTAGDSDPYHPALARTGVLAMMLTGEKSLACIEAKIAPAAGANDPFWNDVNAYCAYALAGEDKSTAAEKLKNSALPVLQALAADSAYAFAYGPKSFARLSLLEKALLVAENRISLEPLNAEKAAAVPASDLLALLAAGNIDDGQRFLLTASAVRYGLLSPGEIAALYKNAIIPAAGKEELMPQPADRGIWENLPYLYRQAENADDAPARQAALREALPYAAQFGPAALAPFAAMIQKTAPAGYTPAETLAAFRIMHTAGLDIPEDWARTVLNRTGNGKNEDMETYAPLALAAAVSLGTPSALQAVPEDARGWLKEHDPKGIFLGINIIENIDKRAKADDNPSRIYEKDFDLTVKSSYVMPSVFVWDQLLSSRQDKNSGETLLLTAHVLGNAPLYKAYPGVIRDALLSINTVGLTDISGDMATEAALGIMK